MNIKKILAVLLVLTLFVTLPITAFAAGQGSSSLDVNATIDGKDNPTEAAVKISVDIAWDEMKFTYTEGEVGTWNATDHTYVGGTVSAWSDNKVSIVVKNHSNTAIQAQFSFSSDINNIRGKFYDLSLDATSGNQVYTEITGTPAIHLDTAEGYNVTTPPTGDVFFGIDATSDGISQSTKLGTITVAISTSNKICGRGSLQKAVYDYEGIGGTITLDQDIDMRGTADPVVYLNWVGEMDLNNGTFGDPLVIDLGGHTVYGYLSCVGANVVIKNGTIAFYEQDFNALSQEVQSELRSSGLVSMMRGKIKLENVEIDNDSLLGLYGYWAYIETAGTFNIGGGMTRGGEDYAGGFAMSHVTFSGEVDIYNKLMYSYGSSITFKAGEGNTYTVTSEITVGDTDLVIDENTSPDDLPGGIVSDRY